MRNNLHEGSEIQIYLCAFKEETKFIDHSCIPLELWSHDWCLLVSSQFLELKFVCPVHSFFSQMSAPQSTGHLPAVDDALCFMFFLWQILSSLIILIMTRDADDFYSYLSCSDNSPTFPINYMPETFLQMTTGTSSWTCSSYSFWFLLMISLFISPLIPERNLRLILSSSSPHPHIQSLHLDLAIYLFFLDWICHCLYHNPYIDSCQPSAGFLQWLLEGIG